VQLFAGGIQNLADPVRALCLSSHGETFVPVNGRNEAIAPAILNQDNRATDEAVCWNEQSEERHFSKLPAWSRTHVSCCEFLWLRKHRPDVFTPSVRFLSVIGYILSRLGLPPYIDYSLASRYLRLIYDSRGGHKKFSPPPK